MATYAGKEVGTRGLGIGGLVTRLAVGGAVTWAALTGGSWVLDRINGNGSNAVVEQGYVNPKSLRIQGKNNAAGNIETYE